ELAFSASGTSTAGLGAGSSGINDARIVDNLWKGSQPETVEMYLASDFEHGALPSPQSQRCRPSPSRRRP
ncbi:hypothetical protein, partial [Bradyrhizobium liaoningense]|uniref:hypothetical protein n=1 Tax=Bradyrhizobium liaoningense TaxID=43992 RepID=UPI001BA813B6